MRLWHKSLVRSLPQKQLISQYRECCAIAKAIKEKGTPNHLLVNKVLEYPIEHFVTYTNIVIEEMKNRGYRCNKMRFFQYFSDETFRKVPTQELFSSWHTWRYFKQCFYNLQEKYDCGGISKNEFLLIEGLYQQFGWGEAD